MHRSNTRRRASNKLSNRSIYASKQEASNSDPSSFGSLVSYTTLGVHACAVCVMLLQHDMLALGRIADALCNEIGVRTGHRTSRQAM